MTFIITAVDSTVCKFRKRYLRRTNLSCEQLFYMLPHSMAIVKKTQSMCMCQECISPSVIQIDFTHKFVLAAILDRVLHKGSISQYLILIGDCGVNAFPFITVSFKKQLQIYDKSAKQTKPSIICSSYQQSSH